LAIIRHLMLTSRITEGQKLIFEGIYLCKCLTCYLQVHIYNCTILYLHATPITANEIYYIMDIYKYNEKDTDSSGNIP